MSEKTRISRIAVTGATGFLGKYLVKHFLDNGYDITVLAREEENAGTCFDLKVKFSITDYSIESLMDVLEGFDVVIHLVGQTLQRDSDPLAVSKFFRANVGILENICIAADKLNIHAIYQMSSNNVYSQSNQIPWVENQIPIPSSVYGLSKLMAEHLGEYVDSKTSVKVVNLRLARLFGYGERDSVVFTKFLKLAIEKKRLEIWGEGKTTIEYLYVRDVVEAIEFAVRNDIPSGTYNVGTGKAYSVIEIAESINKVTGNDGNLLIDRTKQENEYHIMMDSTKFLSVTHWKPKWNLEDAIKEMYYLYKK